MLALAMAPLCGLPDDFGRGVHRTLTIEHGGEQISIPGFTGEVRD